MTQHIITTEAMAAFRPNPPCAEGLDRHILQFRDPHPGGSQGLHEVIEPPVARLSGRCQQAQIVPLVQFPARVPEEFPLAAEGLHPALPPA